MIPLLLPPECCVWHGHVQSDATGSTRSIPGPSDAFIAWARTNSVDLSTLFLEQRPTQSKATGAPSHAFAVAYDVIGHFQTARDADLVMLCWGATPIDRG
jgi:hypothetical protein